MLCMVLEQTTCKYVEIHSVDFLNFNGKNISPKMFIVLAKSLCILIILGYCQEFLKMFLIQKEINLKERKNFRDHSLLLHCIEAIIISNGP